MEIISSLGEYLQYPFVRRALIAGLLVALCSSLLGVTLVLRRFSLIGDGLSHVAFGAMAIAAVLNFTAPMPFVLVFTIIAAMLILSGGSHVKVKGDAATAMLSVGALSVGYLLINVFKRSANVTGDVCTSLFGSTSILTLRSFDMWLTIGISIVIILLFVMFYNRIFAITFDEDFARASGLSARMGNLVMAAVVACVIVLAMNLVGALLVSALIVFPALTSMRLFGSFRDVVIGAAISSMICVVLGILIALLASTPVGPTVVAVNMLAYAFASLIRRG
jgi:zinc transport system permease protein